FRHGTRLSLQPVSLRVSTARGSGGIALCPQGSLAPPTRLRSSRLPSRTVRSLRDKPAANSGPRGAPDRWSRAASSYREALRRPLNLQAADRVLEQFSAAQGCGRFRKETPIASRAADRSASPALAAPETFPV